MDYEDLRTTCHNAPVVKEPRGDGPKLICSACRRELEDGELLNEQ